MQRIGALCWLILVVLGCSFNTQAQVATSAVVPRLVSFSGRALDTQGKPILGVAGISFAVYKEQYQGSPLWMETQNVHPDARGAYTVQLGAATPQGLPLELFSSGEAQLAWSSCKR